MHRLPTVRPGLLLGLALFAAAFLYALPEATDLIDDHFMHVAWGRQLLYGRKPLRDMEALGLPLQALLSAGSEWLLGYRLLSEGVIIASAFAIGGVMTFLLARAASASWWIGAAAALLQVAIAPRTYSYPKIVVYAGGLVLLWRYIDRPSRTGAALLGLAVAGAFYLRHDHGVYLGLLTVAVITLRHSSDWTRCARRLTLLAACTVIAVSPFTALRTTQRGRGRLRSGAAPHCDPRVSAESFRFLALVAVRVVV